MKIKPNVLPCILLTCLLAGPTATLAHNYNYVEGGYLRMDDNGGKDEDGGRLGASGDFMPNFALFGEYADTGPFERATVGVLYHRPLDQRVDLNLGLSVEQEEIGSRDDTGFGARAGLRWQLADNGFELNPELRYVDVSGDGRTSARLSALMPLGEKLGIVAAVQGGDDDLAELGLRYDFGGRRTATP